MKTQTGRWLGVALALAACGEEKDETSTGGGEQAKSAVATYAKIVEASYADSLSAARALQTAVEGFLEAPSEDTLSAAREAWKAAREPYLQTEVYRFYDGPIDHPEHGPEGLMNAWPLDEAYIDYVEGDETAGIVNDPSKTIDAESLAALNEQGGEENIATGYHAIEFLLWGQDLRADGAGARPHTDFLTTGGTAANQDRRATYLRTVTDLLVGHLETLEAAWKAGQSDNYRAELEAAEPDEGLRRVLTGMIVLSGFETGGERLQTALDSGSQEDEHSCFSDNTHRDMVQDIRGIRNVWQGRYTRLDATAVEGPGIRDLVGAEDETLASRLDAEIDESLRLAEALVPPFDQEIATANTEGRARVQALVVALRTQERSLEEVFRLFGLAVPVVE